QMGWEVWVVNPVDAALRSETGTVRSSAAAAESVDTVSAQTLAAWLKEAKENDIAVLDVTASANYVKGHIPGAWFVIRAQMQQALLSIPPAKRYVLTCGTSQLARFAASELKRWVEAEVVVLEGGTQAWIGTNLPLEEGETRLAVPRTDRYRRPYEGTDNAAEAMQAYLDWEYGLIAQLERDGTHFFNVTEK
ncbi:MAG TPA: rhodanese-like domain-containing protein, partial [Noviherbaspirillum sp.]